MRIPETIQAQRNTNMMTMQIVWRQYLQVLVAA